jgi:hypothetical protein
LLAQQVPRDPDYPGPRARRKQELIDPRNPGKNNVRGIQFTPLIRLSGLNRRAQLSRHYEKISFGHPRYEKEQL